VATASLARGIAVAGLPRDGDGARPPGMTTPALFRESKPLSALWLGHLVIQTCERTLQKTVLHT